MILIEKTLYDTVKAYYDKLRYLGQPNDCAWEKMMFLNIVNDIADWADFLEVSQETQIKLHELMQHYTLKNSEFLISRSTPDVYATNVNIPQTSWTWRTLSWDITQGSADTITDLDVEVNCDYIPRWHTISLSQFEDLKANIEYMSETDKKDYWLVYDRDNNSESSHDASAGKPYYFHPTKQEFRPFIDLLGEGIDINEIAAALKVQLNHEWKAGSLDRTGEVITGTPEVDSLTMMTAKEAEALFDE